MRIYWFLLGVAHLVMAGDAFYTGLPPLIQGCVCIGMALAFFDLAINVRRRIA